jgi:DNA-binding IscR family transcriptional regulator
MDIVRVIDGEKRIKSCVLGIKDCDMDNPCVLHKLVGANKAKFIKVLQNTTILDLVEGKQDLEEFFPI